VLSTLVGDARFALRGLAKHRTFTATAVLSLSLGIGVNTGIFTVLRALLLQPPLPYPHADRLVILWNTSPGLNITQDWFSTRSTSTSRRRDGVRRRGACDRRELQPRGDGVEPERIGCIRTSSNLLPLLGGGLAAGRLFEPDDDVPGRAGTAILSSRRRGRAATAAIPRRSAGPFASTISLPDRRHPESRLCAAARSDAHAGRCRRGRDLSAAAAVAGCAHDAHGRGLQHHRAG
jgi:hypothetical protein